MITKIPIGYDIATNTWTSRDGRTHYMWELDLEHLKNISIRIEGILERGLELARKEESSPGLDDLASSAAAGIRFSVEFEYGLVRHAVDIEMARREVEE